MNTQYFSIKEVAAILGISSKTVYKMVVKNQIPGHFKLGSIHFIDKEIFQLHLKKLANRRVLNQ